MAARNLAPLRTLKRQAIPIMGCFRPNGSSAIDATTRLGPGWTVARTGTGAYTITLSDKFSQVLSLTCGLQEATPSGSQVEIGAVSLSSKTIVIQNTTDDAVSGIPAAADLAADAGTYVHFVFWLTDSLADPIRG